MEWKTIKKDAYAYMYGMEDRLCAKLKEKIRASLERQLEILMHRAFMSTMTSPMEPHDGPTLDLLPTEYRVIRQRGAPLRGRVGTDLAPRSPFAHQRAFDAIASSVS